MVWSDVRNNYPNQWLIIEALEAHTTTNSQRQLDHIMVVEKCVDGNSAMEAYRRLHQIYPREFYFVHTGREKLDIRERQWIGIRRSRSEGYGLRLS